MKRIGNALGTLFLALPLIAAADPVDHGELVKLDTRPGVTQGIFITTPGQATPRAVIVLYGGGEGRLHLQESGPRTSRDNFVIRTASYWLDHGYAIVQVDAPSDHLDSFGLTVSVRRSDDILTDEKAISAEIRKRFPGVKIVLYGTSRGTVSEGSILMKAPELADIYVLTSPVSIARKDIEISDLNVPQAYRDKTMLMSNEHDGCPTAAHYGAEQLARRNDLTLITESSDESEGAECGPESPHGYLGIEQKALDDSRAWLETKLQ
jgi:hypothetical protein